MSRKPGRFRARVAGLLIVLAAAVTALAQTSPSSSSDQPLTPIQEQSERLYAGAHPYMDEPAPQLKKSVHELSALQPSEDQSQLAALMAKVGGQADALLQAIPDLISDEQVHQAQWNDVQGGIGGCVGSACTIPPTSTQNDQKYDYLILTHPAPGARMALSEYRTTRKGKKLAPGGGAPNFEGFISAWVVFSSANQVESRFRYLGEQSIDKHKTFVIGFAQIPGATESPAQILAETQSVPMLLQGIAWVDQENFRIIRLRTDLLAPQPEIRVDAQVANISFGPVHIANLPVALWLPQTVTLAMRARAQVFSEEHKYSNYRLYQATSRIVIPGDANSP